MHERHEIRWATGPSRPDATAGAPALRPRAGAAPGPAGRGPIRREAGALSARAAETAVEPVEAAIQAALGRAPVLHTHALPSSMSSITSCVRYLHAGPRHASTAMPPM